MNRRMATMAWRHCIEAGDAALDAGCEFVEEAIDETLSCIECDRRVRFFDRYCSHCDQAFPVRLRWKAGLLMFGVPILLTALLLV